MLKTFSITDIGKRRKLNQDYVYTSELPVGHLANLFLVADGMGGHNAGDYASRYTIETIVDEISRSDDESTVFVLEKAIKRANELIRKKSEEETELSGMGTTVVAATIEDDKLCVANVGDSRLYIINNREIRQITRDHSLVEEMVRMGGLKREMARNHPDKNIITRAIGALDDVDVDFFEVRLNKGDTILMCSDGLSNMIEDEEIRMIMQGQRDIVEKAESLVKAANNNGGKDNIAVVLVEPFADEDNR
ncbi:MAG: Stp1/IreP family PP2C-type Ser/Thr phosphatase [Lachnospiraceae bacterium]|nr:Stp1/IreP family PP2C-type Ser/Thr phosphatase [Lachnospiraceae bacterium]